MDALNAERKVVLCKSISDETMIAAVGVCARLTTLAQVWQQAIQTAAFSAVIRTNESVEDVAAWARTSGFITQESTGKTVPLYPGTIIAVHVVNMQGMHTGSLIVKMGMMFNMPAGKFDLNHTYRANVSKDDHTRPEVKELLWDTATYLNGEVVVRHRTITTIPDMKTVFSHEIFIKDNQWVPIRPTPMVPIAG